MQYCLHIKAFLTIFIQSFCSHQKAILLSAVLMVTSHSESTVDLRLFVRTPTENAILLWSTAAAAIQFYQHKRLTNTYTQSRGVRKNTILQTESTFLLLLDNCFNLFLNYREYHKMWTFGLNIYIFTLDSSNLSARTGQKNTMFRYSKLRIFVFIWLQNNSAQDWSVHGWHKITEC